MPYLEPRSLDRSIIAPSIYGEFPHHVTDTCLVVEGVIKTELETFMREYITFLGAAARRKCFRLDLYPTTDSMCIIEANVEVADGWGVALNLQRAGKLAPLPPGNELPSVFPTFPDDPRQTEFRLAIDEFARVGRTARMVEETERTFDPLDNKLHLARFSDRWSGERVTVPKFYHEGNTEWEDVPENVYLKFTDKFCVEAVKARYSAKPRSELGRAKQMRRMFVQGKALAQARVPSFRTETGEQVQAVVMCSGARVVTGYVQVAPADRNVINDKGTAKGILRFL